MEEKTKCLTKKLTQGLKFQWYMVKRMRSYQLPTQEKSSNFLNLQKGDVIQTLSNSNLLKSITGYNPTTKYRTGIKKFLDWYKNYYKL